MTTELMERNEIEILDAALVPEDIQDPQAREYLPYLFVENVLGIPKKALIKAFISAKVDFFNILSKVDPDLGINLSSL